MNRGFSLVELSIVLVIIGLLVGGILVGRDMMHAAELRSLISQYERYVTAVNVFKGKYHQLPGDMTNATWFWGTMSSGTCPDATGGVGTETCDGDGDGMLEKGGAMGGQTEEIFLFWQHLGNAGLIEGIYTGVSGSGSPNDSEVGENVPGSKIKDAGWTPVWATGGSFVYGTGLTYHLDYRNAWQVGLAHSTAQTYLPFLSPKDAWNIDRKIDDGAPARGKLIARYWDNACAAADDGTHANNDYDASYRLTDDTIQCSLIFRYAY